jgi:WD40 repeat protein
MDRKKEILQKLKSLSREQFCQLLFLLEIPAAELPDDVSQTEKAIEIYYMLQPQQDGLKRLEEALEHPSIKILSSSTASPIKARVDEIVSDYTQLFVGRDEEEQQLDDFLTENSSGMLLVRGGAGMGKTALLANWKQKQKQQGNCFIAYHFFRQGEETSNVIQAYRYLLRQLYAYYELTTPQIPTSEYELKDRICQFLQEPRKEKPLVILLDALDEATPERSLSLTLPQPLPEGLYVIASVRLNKEEKLDNLPGWIQVNKQVFLEHLPSPAIKDWLRRAGNGELVTLAQDETFVAQVCDRTEGIPLFLKHLIDELVQVAKQGEESVIRNTLAATPKGFAEFIRQQYQALDRLEDWRSRPDLRKIFYFLTIAKGELSSYDFRKLIGESPVGLPWQVSRWFKIREIGNSRLFSFNHSTLAEQFAVLPEINENTEESQEKLLEYCANWQKHHKSRYALRCYAEHLRDGKRWKELYNLLTKFEYIDKKISVLGVHPLIGDYDLAFAPESITTNKNIENLRLIQGALRLSAHILEEDKTQLAGQLWGRLERFKVPVIQEMLQQAQHRQTSPWLCPLTPSLTSPDEPLIRTYKGHTDSVWSVAVTPDGNKIISGSQDGTIKIWNLNSGNLEHTIEAHNDSVKTVCTDGLRIISGSRDKTIKIWNLKTGEIVRTLSGHLKAVNAIVLTRNSSKIISGSDDKTLKIWELRTGELLHTFVGNCSPVQTVTTVFAKNKEWIVYSPYNHILRVWNLETGEEEFTLGESDKVWSEKVLSIAATRDEQHVVTTSQNGTIIVWKVGTWKKECTFKGHSESIHTVAVTPDGKYIISGSSFYGTIKIWRLDTLQNEATFIGHTASVLAVTVTPDGQKIISASGNSLNSSEYLLKVWHLEKCIKQKNECEITIAHSDSVEVVTFTPDGKEVISVSKDHTLKIWQVGTWKNKATFKGQSKFACFYRDDGWEIIFQFEGDEIKCCFCSTRNTLPYLLATTADSQVQAWVSEDETIQVWDASARRFISRFTGESEIKCCAIAPDGVTIVAGEQSGRLHFLYLEGT